MWDNLIEQINIEREQLNLLLSSYHLLVEKCMEEEPDSIEILAVSALLNSYYSGIENIFKRIAKEIDGFLPQGATWHRDLLDQMSISNSQRTSVISKMMREHLIDYLHFRHVFRQAYSFQLQWRKILPLVKELKETWRGLELELDAFVKSIENKDNY